MAQSDHYDLSPAENPSADIREMDASDYRERNILVSVPCPSCFFNLRDVAARFGPAVELVKLLITVYSCRPKVIDAVTHVRTRIVLAEDHALVAQGFKALLNDTFDLVGVVNDGRALLAAVETLHPDVIVADISMPLLNGLDAIRRIRSRWPAAKVIVLTMHKEAELAAEALRAGALGYMLKISPVEELIGAIRQVAQGRAYVTTLLLKDLLALLLGAGRQSRGDNSPLTPRQREVLQLIAEGRTMKEVASILKISPRTAESHKYEIMKALGVQTTAELIQYAIRKRLVAD
jgi:DNA-binding NarL/FixJ family response regulator